MTEALLKDVVDPRNGDDCAGSVSETQIESFLFTIIEFSHFHYDIIFLSLSFPSVFLADRILGNQ